MGNGERNQGAVQTTTNNCYNLYSRLDEGIHSDSKHSSWNHGLFISCSLAHCSRLVGTVNHRLTWSTIVVVKWSWEGRLFLFWHGGLNPHHHIVFATSSNDQWEDDWHKESEFGIRCDARIIQYQTCLTLLLLYSVFISPKRNQDPMTIYRHLRHCVISPTAGKDIDYLHKWTGVWKTPSGD